MIDDGGRVEKLKKQRKCHILFLLFVYKQKCPNHAMLERKKENSQNNYSKQTRKKKTSKKRKSTSASTRLKVVNKLVNFIILESKKECNNVYNKSSFSSAHTKTLKHASNRLKITIVSYIMNRHKPCGN